jgi:hypothetical protein
MDIQTLVAELAELEENQALNEKTNLAGRMEALKLGQLINELVRLKGRTKELVELQSRSVRLQVRFEAINRQLFSRVWTDLQVGTFDQNQLRRFLDQFTTYQPKPDQRHFGPDGLDYLLDGVFGLAAPPPATLSPEAEMIHLEHTPARVILDLIDHADLKTGDIFYDIGSGLGQIAILVHLLTGVVVWGVEIEPAYCLHASDYAINLELFEVHFVQVDARNADYCNGTVFFMFAPFTGKMLQAVLDKLKIEAQQRPIKLCTYGPCTPQVLAQPWLTNSNGSGGDEFKLAVFVSHEV